MVFLDNDLNNYVDQANCFPTTLNITDYNLQTTPLNSLLSSWATKVQ